ncbi:MAG: ABC transporter ATP-binding protein [Deltaproteobacteria bacterium]|nr:ABC transporter ATP-binding protein [Deltaproteobacteria bacterium]
MSLLKVQEVSKYFGGLVANQQISFDVEEGEIVGLIGPNGAGKTTLFNCIAGYYPVTSGRVFFHGRDITFLKDFEISRMGLARTFQVYAASGDLNVLENIMIGAFLKTPSRKKAQERSHEVMDFMGLRAQEKNRMTEIPVAAQKRVTLATALATGPKMILLDEVAAGLNPSEIEELIALLLRINQEMKITLLLTEHVMELVMRLSKKVVVLESGKKIAEGEPRKVIQDEEVIRAYLGESFLKHRQEKDKA